MSKMMRVNMIRRFAALPAMSKRALSTTDGLLGKYGIAPAASTKVFRNLSYDDIFIQEVAEGQTVVSNGTVTVDTGKFTGRSPKDKYIVESKPSSDEIWWGPVNRPMKPETFSKLNDKVVKHYNQAKKIYVFDGYSGANPISRKKVRFITEYAWQHHFVTNMFLRPKDAKEIENFEPDFTIINGCNVTNEDWKKDGLNSEVFVTFNLEESKALIGGTFYGGEMKKGIFSMMHYWLPLQGIMSMHCSANIGKKGDTALYFGLSGTGKTTLSADPHRQLIGDDEHGWDDHGIFNFEGGCYAKTINLAEETEPDIYHAIRRDALLENVHVDPETKVVDFFNVEKTQNGRVSYPIHHIDNFKKDSAGGHPTSIFFLTCDAYGVLPPVSRLSPGQAMYHFLSGYTAKVAGTERGVTEPEATFSACFGAAFLTLHPTRYADLLKEKLHTHDTSVFLINTGWAGGGVSDGGKRMSIKATRGAIDSVLSGDIHNAPMRIDERFGFEVPTELHGVPTELLNPRENWPDKAKYDAAANKLVGMFKENFTKFVQPGMTDYTEYGPK
jgi:ATP-dependent phosphoenolpyruvate carboxykinase